MTARLEKRGKTESGVNTTVERGLERIGAAKAILERRIDWLTSVSRGDAEKNRSVRLYQELAGLLWIQTLLRGDVEHVTILDAARVTPMPNELPDEAREQ